MTNYNDKLKIMLVDDESDVTAILKAGLEKHGLLVDVFNNPTQALSAYKPDYYDLVITDIRMPVMTGFELARGIWEKDADVSVCFMSSFEIYEGEARKVFPTMKNYCFIKKPVTPSALALHVQAHLSLA